MAASLALYSGASTLALVSRVSVFFTGLTYGAIKLKYLKATAIPKKKKVEAESQDSQPIPPMGNCSSTYPETL